MNIDFDKVINRRGTNSAKWDTQAVKYDNNELLHFGVADMDFLSPQPIQDALKKVINNGVYGYTDINEDFYKSIQDHYKKKYDLIIPKEWIVYSPRVINSAAAFINVSTKINDGVIINEPCYSPLKDAIVTNNRNAIGVATKFIDDRWKMNFEEIETLSMNENNTAMFFVNPDNPTGTVWNADDIDELMKVVSNNNITVFTDEIHADLLKHDVTHHSLIEYADEYDKVIIANSLTKTYNIPGLEISYLIVPNKKIRSEIKSEFYKMGIHNPNIFSLPAFIAGYRDCEEWLKSVNIYIDENERIVRDFISKYIPKFKIYPRQGTYTLWINYTELNISDEKLEDWFLNDVGAEVYMGNAFGKYGDGFIRLNIGTSKVLILKLLNSMKEKMFLLNK